MFGSKLKTWMENHIGRPKRKIQQERDKTIQNGGRGVILESSESLAQSDTGVSSGSQQVLSSSTTDNKEGYCTTTMESERSGMTHCHTAVSLPSPESAYSTGYSTDGASPGGNGPPEYYINIRTGKHYFPSPAPTPTSPMPTTVFSNSMPARDVLPTTRLSAHAPETLDTRKTSDTHFDIFNITKSPCKKSQLTSFRLFLKSPKGKAKVDANESKNKVLSPTKTKKWYKQPFQKFGNRRTDESPPKSETKTETETETNLTERSVPYLLTKEMTSSPRQRNRIKTNPWLPTEPMSSQNFHGLQINFSPSLARNRSCSNTPLQNRKTNESDVIHNRIKQMSIRYEDLQKNRQKGYLEPSDHSEEDLTLNEMMGTFNESYVYEKETDILSDSDPTDCEDYETDSEADNGGDEQDSHDDELDFIDNGSVAESEDNFAGNTGKCTYHDVYSKSSFLYKCHHSRRNSECRKSFRREQENKGRRSKEEKRRKNPRRSLKGEADKEEERRRSETKAKINENVGGLNLSRVLMERMMTKNGTKSAEGTPASIRKLRETHIGQTKIKEKLTQRELLLMDAEADRKYSQLIMEAENIFESLQNSPVIQTRKKMAFTEEKSVSKIKQGTGGTWKPETGSQLAPKDSVRRSPKNLGLKLTETPKKMRQLDFGPKNSFKAKSSAHSPLDPLGPTFRNFTIFKPTNVDKSSSSSEDSIKIEQKTGVTVSPVVPIAFQSVDLGKPLTSYCPQSEPVKRKIYSCSKTYDKLVKEFEKKPAIFEEKKRPRHGSLGAKRRCEEGPRTRSGNQGLGLVKAPRGETATQGRHPCPGVPPYSPRLPSRRSSVPSPNLLQRRSFDVDVFR